jgi:hypothetical protein
VELETHGSGAHLIEQTFGQMEGYTRPELANQRQMINYLIQRTGAQRIPE